MQKRTDMSKPQDRLKLSLKRLTRWLEFRRGGMIHSLEEVHENARSDACAWGEDARNDNAKIGEGPAF